MRNRAAYIVLMIFVFASPCAVATTPLPVGPEINLFVFHPFDPNVVYAATRAGIFITTDQGARWSRHGGFPSHGIVWALVMHPQKPETLYAAVEGEESGVYRSVDGGKSWRPTQATGAPAFALALDPRRPDIVFAAIGSASNRSALVKSTDGGSSWQVMLEGPRVHIGGIAVDATDPQKIYAGSDGVVLRSSDGGAHWERSEDVTFRGDRTWVGDLTVNAKEPHVMYAKTGGGQMKSIDGGHTWQAIEDKCHRYRPGRQVSKVIFAFCENSESVLPVSAIRRSIDGGATWKPVGAGLPPSPWFAPDIAAHPADPGIVFAGWANGGAYRSRDGGETWLPICNGITWRDLGGKRDAFECETYRGTIGAKN